MTGSVPTSPGEVASLGSGVPMKWFHELHPGQTGGPVVVCFPHAGGTVSALRRWFRDGVEDLRVLAVQPPGREDRLGEPVVRTFGKLKEELSGPLGSLMSAGAALFGHSMGALVAFRFALDHQLEGGIGPRHLFVSARRGPRVQSQASRLHAADDQTFVAWLRQMHALPKEALSSPALVELMLPSVKGDFALSHNLERETMSMPQPLLIRSPITAFAGLSDRAVPAEMLRLWRRHTSARFCQHHFEGDHYFPRYHGRTMLSIIHRTLVQEMEGAPMGTGSGEG